MPATSYFGLRTPVGSDVASTALTDATNQNILDASAGHVWQVSTGTNSETVVFLVNAVSPTGVASATAKAATLSAMMSLNAAGLFQIFASPTAGVAGGLVTWVSPFFSVSPTGTTTAVVSFTTLNLQTISTSGIFTTTLSSAIIGTATPSLTASDGFLYVPMVASTPTGTPTVQAGHAAVVATSQTMWINPGATATWYTAGSAPPQVADITAATQTYTVPANARALWVRIVAGGGGGKDGTNSGAGGGGGGSGAYSEGWFTSLASSYLVTNGAAGVVGADGGDSSFGSLITAVKGGKGATGQPGGAGGAAGSGGTSNFGGTAGAPGVVFNSGDGWPGGSGGSSVFGGAGSGGTGSTVPATAAQANSGSGGGGGGSGTGAHSAGAAGAAGHCIVVAFF